MAYSSPARGPSSSFPSARSLSSPAYRAPNRSQATNSSIEYERRRGETTYDKGFYVSHDGRRAVQTEMNVGLKKRRVMPADLEDSFAQWTPLAEDNDAQLEPDDEASATGEKRKRYVSSDETMTPWRPLVQVFLDEMLRREGLNAAPKCPCCKTPWARGARRFRCKDCGEFVQCWKCVVDGHECDPLHRVQEWNGTYWVKTTLNKLGCVYQLGHRGQTCPRPAPAIREMVVMDVSGVHTVKYRWCGCGACDDANNLQQLLRTGWYPATTVDPATCATFDALELFRLLNVVGNVNVHDFVGTLERRTDACDVKKVPDRYKQFGRMSRQWAFLKRLLHAGRGHCPNKIHGTRNGECAVMCWACPHDNINIPEGWRDVAPEFRFLYMIFLAMDANFRLKNRLRANEHEDLPLGSGWGYMVEDAPYKKHLAGYVAEEDVSTCIAFAALLQKDTRLTTGLRCSGVGGVVCARHELVRLQGVGDLQKRERYVREYGLHIAVGSTGHHHHVLGNLLRHRLPMARMEAMPESMRLNLEDLIVLSGLPVWHAAAHERSCQAQNSLSYMVGAGRTDGEGIERTWSVLNPLGWATKEKSQGGRADAIEDKINHHNFEKNINQGTTLPKKLILAINERDRQKQIDEWVTDRTKPNPYLLKAGAAGGATEAAIRLGLTQEEAREAAGGAKLHGSSMSSFLTTGLQLEGTQRRIRREVKGRTLLAADHSQKVADIRKAFFMKLGKFRKLQAVYMPGAIQELEEEEDERDAELPPVKAEDVRLFLPSELRQASREEGSLHTKKYLLDWRDSNVVGQRAATRAGTLMERVGERMDSEATKYIRARAALVALRGRNECTEWRELKPADIQLDEEREVDAKARRKLGNIGSKKWRRAGPAMSSKEKRLSWIWTAGGGPGVDEEELHDSVRVEWSKAKARKERWEEEVMLLREEMKRVLRFLRWRAVWWETRRATRREEVSAELRAGLEAYAARQAAGSREIARRFKSAWDASAATAVRSALQDDAILAESMGVFADIVAAGDEGNGMVEGQERDSAGEDVSGEEGERIAQES
ncbi:hypothetical protein C8F04DRAFT_1281664 [Mycena alexandri]|uniref:CxC2-like cysteine cluster KDZ transposase-associated domain-containing protein n=1 Tax=Mycena alexandri TaxID=1745969 RepID=A0AAD6RW34_9AGAR|nr:hypothetical protein C8F04DRAFT_1281664 [Mycena alexandri]